MAQLSFSDLVQEMKGNKTTNDYDVLVAYNEAKVNEMLKNQAQARGPLTLGPFKIPVYDERQDEYYDKNVVMNVAPPVLRFSGLDQVILNLEVTSGTTQIGKGAQKPLARGLSVELKAQLCNAPGRVDQDGNFQTTKENDGGFKDSKPVDYKVTLNPKQKDAAQGVCIDMTSVTASVNPKDGNDTLAKKEADALAVTTSQIRKYFQESKSFTYYLAGVSNKYASEAGSHLLRPESFKFSIVASGTAEAALCMWIEVSGGSHNGKESSRSSPATFHPRDRDCNPVPSGSTACVIMHHDLLWDKFLKVMAEP